jgi:hypothetical protein
VPPAGNSQSAPPPAAPETAGDADGSSLVEVASWSVPLALAGALMAGLVLAPMVRRRQPALPQPAAEHRLPSNVRPDPAAAYRSAVAPAPAWDDRRSTYPGGEEHTLLTRQVRPVTSSTKRPVRNSVATASNARLNGSPLPYVHPVESPAADRPGYSTNVTGLA